MLIFPCSGSTVNKPASTDAVSRRPQCPETVLYSYLHVVSESVEEMQNSSARKHFYAVLIWSKWWWFAHKRQLKLSGVSCLLVAVGQRTRCSHRVWDFTVVLWFLRGLFGVFCTGTKAGWRSQMNKLLLNNISIILWDLLLNSTQVG